MEAETISLFRLKINRVPHWFQFSVCLIGIIVFNSISTQLNATLCNDCKISGLYLIPFLGFALAAFLSFPHLGKFLASDHSQFTTLFLFAAGILTAISRILNYFAILQIKRSQVSLFESTNIISILAVNAFLIGKKYSYAQVISICLISIGFYHIALSNFNGRSKHNIFAMIALVVSSSIDAIVLNMEEHFFKTVHFQELKSIIVSTAAVVTGMLAILDDETFEIARKCSTNLDILILLILFAVSSYISLSFVFASIKLFGAVITTMFIGIQITEMSTISIGLHKRISASVLVSHLVIYGAMFVFLLRPVIDKKTNRLRIYTEEILQIFTEFPDVDEINDSENIQNAV